jgi:hypothetical protein
MKPLVKEWVAKAEGDFNPDQREFRARTNPNYDAVCFHAQQCALNYKPYKIGFNLSRSDAKEKSGCGKS